jgi:hypothetical protein
VSDGATEMLMEEPEPEKPFELFIRLGAIDIFVREGVLRADLEAAINCLQIHKDSL